MDHEIPSKFTAAGVMFETVFGETEEVVNRTYNHGVDVVERLFREHPNASIIEMPSELKGFYMRLTIMYTR